MCREESNATVRYFAGSSGPASGLFVVMTPVHKFYTSTKPQYGVYVSMVLATGVVRDVYTCSTISSYKFLIWLVIHML